MASMVHMRAVTSMACVLALTFAVVAVAFVTGVRTGLHATTVGMTFTVMSVLDLLVLLLFVVLYVSLRVLTVL